MPYRMPDAVVFPLGHFFAHQTRQQKAQSTQNVRSGHAGENSSHCVDKRDASTEYVNEMPPSIRFLGEMIGDRRTYGQPQPDGTSEMINNKPQQDVADEQQM